MSLEDKLARVPDQPGVYLYRDGKQLLLPLGCSAECILSVDDSDPRSAQAG